MKKYSVSVHKLYEAVGFEKLEKGKSYTSKKNTKVSIEDMYIDATQEVPVTMIKYSFETQSGQKGNLTAPLEDIIETIRNN